jgi:hypothetical protein
MKRPSSTVTPSSRKRQRLSLDISSGSEEAPVDNATLTEMLSLHDQAEPYRLATVKFPIDALTAFWKDGSNRPINQIHKRQLCQLFKKPGLQRTEVGNRLRVACTKVEVERMMESLHRDRQVKEHLVPGNKDGGLLSFQDWMHVIGVKAELMAGNHRVEALKEHLRQVGNEQQEERWWACDLYDRGNTPFDIFNLR